MFMVDIFSFQAAEPIEAQRDCQTASPYWDDVVEPHHQFPSINFRGHAWDLRHLDAFAIRIDPKLGFEIDVIVLFSCHCFTHQVKHDPRSPLEIPECEIYEDRNERRVLSKERYELSRRFLPGLVKEFGHKHIRFGRQYPQNFFIAEGVDIDSTPGSPRC